MASKTLSIKDTSMTYALTMEVSKKIKHFDGSEIVRKGKVTIPQAHDTDKNGKPILETGSNEAALELYGNDLWKFADHGAKLHARTTATNALMGGPSDPKTKSLMRDFKNAVKTFTDVMEMEPAEAFENAKNRNVFKSLAPYFDAMKDAKETVILDYTSKLPTPRWFEGDEDEPEETETEETAS